jgi:hypothetical protein
MPSLLILRWASDKAHDVVNGLRRQTHLVEEVQDGEVHDLCLEEPVRGDRNAGQGASADVVAVRGHAIPRVDSFWSSADMWTSGSSRGVSRFISLLDGRLIRKVKRSSKPATITFAMHDARQSETGESTAKGDHSARSSRHHNRNACERTA